MINPTAQDLRLFADLVENENNMDFQIHPKLYHDYLMSINMLSESLSEELIETSRTTADLAFHRFFELSYQRRRYVASATISRKSVREEVFDKHGNYCLKCGNAYDLAIDHIISVKNGGSNEIDNLQPLCKSCNSGKGARNIDYRFNK